MSDILNDILAYIATPSGFLVFIVAMTMAYGGIWFLFLFEAQPPRKKSPAKGEGEKAEEETPRSRKEKQPVPSG